MMDIRNNSNISINSNQDIVRRIRIVRIVRKNIYNRQIVMNMNINNKNNNNNSISNIR